jgi:predicted DNA-binding transcriptional regulator YafY
VNAVQIHRLFEIVYLLIERKTMTAGQLAEHFEVSRRTVLRDIDVLSGAGIPLYATRGKGGGIALLDGYVLSKAFFSKREQAGILAALEQLSAAQYPDTQSVLQKLKGIFLKQPTDWLEVDLSYWNSAAVDREKMALIETALFHKQALRFTYASAKGETSARLVYPLKLVFKSMAWYLSTYCTAKRDYRVFKLSRIRDAALADEYFGDLNLTAPPLRIDAPPQEPTPMTLRIHPRQAHRVYDEFEPEQISLQENGFFLVRTAMPAQEWAYGYLLTFGPDLEVLQPPAIREAMVAAAEAILQKYR